MAETAPETVTITVDDVEYQVPAGILLIDAITQYTGYDMPRFCHHDKLVPVGMCRMCMAEVEGRGRWANVATCTIRVADGMQVKVMSDAAVQARKMTLELLLVDHPLDCPVCDKGGECMLQDQTVADGPDVARTVELRRTWPKPLAISERVLLDRERCVRCARCTRYVDEIAGEPTIMLINRGAKTEVAPALDGQYDGHFTGNTCDICPVGALTSSTFRFRSRPWELQDQPAISPYDAGGANLFLSVRENVVRRALPRENPAVNDVWCSDKDRFHYDFILDDDRLDVPLVRNAESGELEPATFDDALSAACEGLAKTVQAGRPIAGLGSGVLSCEEQYVFQKLVRQVLGSNHLSLSKPYAAEQRSGLTPTYDELEQASTFLLVGPRPVGELPNAWLRIYKALRFKGAKLLTLGCDDYLVKLTTSLGVHCNPGGEADAVRGILGWLVAEKKHDLGTIRSKTRGFGEVGGEWEQYTLEQAAADSGADADKLKALAEQLLAAENLVVVAPMSSGRPDGSAAADALWNLALALGVPRMDHGGFLEPLFGCNTRGASDLGVRPDVGPGYQPVDEPGLGGQALQDAMAAGEVGAALIVGSDWVSDHGNRFQEVRNEWLNQSVNGDFAAAQSAEASARKAALEQVPFVVVTELFLSETAKLADVVLPATCFAERAGTYVNLEGRVQYAPAAVRPILGVRSDLELLNALAAGVAERLGQSAWSAFDTEAAWTAVTSEVAAYAGATREALRSGSGVVTKLDPPDGRFEFVALD